MVEEQPIRNVPIGVLLKRKAARDILHFMQHTTTALIIDFSTLSEPNAACAAVEANLTWLIFQFRHSLADGVRSFATVWLRGGKSQTRQLWRIPTFVFNRSIIHSGLSDLNHII